MPAEDADITDALREATPVTVGEPAPGQINHDADVEIWSGIGSYTLTIATR